MSINQPSFPEPQNQEEYIDQFNIFSDKVKKEYIHFTLEQKQNRWNNLFSDHRSCYYITTGPFSLAKLKQRCASMEGDVEQFIPDIVMLCRDTKTLNGMFETTSEEQDRIFEHLATYAEKHGKQQEIEEFIYYSIRDNQRYLVPITIAQQKFLLQYGSKYNTQDNIEAFIVHMIFIKKCYHRPLHPEQAAFLCEYAKKYDYKKQEIEDFIAPALGDNIPYQNPLTGDQRNLVHQNNDIDYIPLSEDEKQEFWNQDFLIMMENDAGVEVLFEDPEEKYFPLSFAEHVHTYSIMEQNFIRFIPGILRHLEDNGYKKEIDEIFSFPPEEQHLPAQIRVGIELQKIGQHMKDNLKKETE